MEGRGEGKRKPDKEERLGEWTETGVSCETRESPAETPKEDPVPFGERTGDETGEENESNPVGIKTLSSLVFGSFHFYPSVRVRGRTDLEDDYHPHGRE